MQWQLNVFNLLQIIAEKLNIVYNVNKITKNELWEIGHKDNQYIFFYICAHKFNKLQEVIKKRLDDSTIKKVVILTNTEKPLCDKFKGVVIPICDIISIKKNGITVLKKAFEQQLNSLNFQTIHSYNDNIDILECNDLQLDLKGETLRYKENNTVEVARRDTLEKQVIPQAATVEKVSSLMEEIQKGIFRKSYDFRGTHTFMVDDYSEFKEIMKDRPGFLMAHWDGTTETEELIKNETKATIRCIPVDAPEEKGKCIRSGKPSDRRVLFALAY